MAQLHRTVLLLTLVALSLGLRATDILGGNVSGTWTAEEGPYIIQGDIRVPENETLNIEAGTEVRFDGQYFLRIVGNINVNGAPGDSVSFV